MHFREIILVPAKGREKRSERNMSRARAGTVGETEEAGEISRLELTGYSIRKERVPE